ncbi:hypothetical protein JCM14202_1625 [Agrilactobacillus composti DSM 18527 = JCM 14202]|uniref:DNA phosphorothioation-dependent restriction protein DptF n=1 Tax=Agrilactobacillus composti TaxID=398555 RepID=UPI00042E105A|nr:DNA phosphorothioation-dependent restriction protein DptF [Agrilactobacillus composti]GAF39750.1 hypothetical protein JCM14202_1625 [Agrilactobacillus composti DSM 18527 = JCM 14202]
MLLDTYDVPNRDLSLDSYYHNITYLYTHKKIEGYDHDDASNVYALCQDPQQISESDLQLLQHLIEKFTHVNTGPAKLRQVFEKLSIKSKNALIAGNAQLDSFHNYLHVKRQVETDFEYVLTQIVPSSPKTLTLIVGNVGDGKSHLLSVMQTRHEAMFEKFAIHIHNDATESFDPAKTALETMADVLAPFNDVNIHDGHDYHLIVAINMGVLVNFSRYISAEASQFSEFLTFLNASKILTDADVPGDKKEIFQILTFRDSPFYELADNKVSSSLITELLHKITQETTDNPFWQAYQQDRQAHRTDIVLTNYEILLNPKVQACLVRLLTGIQIQFQQILSMRQILNFFHDIIVPPTNQTTNFKALMPYLLFEGQRRSSILAAVSALDPAANQNQLIDNFNSRIFNTLNYEAEVKHIFNQNGLNIGIFTTFFNNLSHYQSKVDAQLNHTYRINFFLRVLFLLDDENPAFATPAYTDFIQALGQAEQGRFTKELQTAFQQGILNWNGKTKNGYMLKSRTHHNLAIKVSFRLRDKQPIQRDKANIVIFAQITNANSEIEDCKVVIDYKVFSLLIKIQNGYIIRNDDIENAVDFDKFVQRLVGDSQTDAVIITDPELPHQYKLEKGMFGFILEDANE